MTRIFACHTGIGPIVSGEALVAADNFSARYDLDRIKGVFSRPQHLLFGQSYSDKIRTNTAKEASPLPGCCMKWSRVASHQRRWF